jgi:hypothetical protein
MELGQFLPWSSSHPGLLLHLDEVSRDEQQKSGVARLSRWLSALERFFFPLTLVKFVQVLNEK